VSVNESYEKKKTQENYLICDIKLYICFLNK